MPTKNRYEYLKHLVDSVNTSKTKEIELIIQDNSEEGNHAFSSYVLGLSDSRIKYNYSYRWMSVVENCELAVEAATSDFVCMLGDDDSIIIDLALKIVKYAKCNFIDAVVVNKAEYYWPETVNSVWGTNLSGKIFYKDYSFDIKQVDHKKELAKVLRNGGTSSLEKMPGVYHGFVSRESMSRLRKNAGTCFPGSSPDMANAVGLSLTVNKVIYFDGPAVISGHGRKSAGGMGGEKKHHGKIEDQSHLPKHTARNWNPKVPMFWSGATIYADSILQTLSKLNKELDQNFNYDYLYAYCIVFEPNYIGRIVQAAKAGRPKFLKVLSRTVYLIFYRIINLCANVYKFRVNSDFRFAASNSNLAQMKLADILGINGRSYDK